MEVKLSRTGEKVELHISTITLVPNDTMSLFRCVVCGSAISQYVGSVIKIYPFLEPAEGILTINKCPGCGALYNYQSQSGKKIVTKVTLYKNPFIMSVDTFKCYNCRADLLKYNLDHIFDLFGMHEAFLPISIKCPTLDCPATYNFWDVV